MVATQMFGKLVRADVGGVQIHQNGGRDCSCSGEISNYLNGDNKHCRN